MIWYDPGISISCLSVFVIDIKAAVHSDSRTGSRTWRSIYDDTFWLQWWGRSWPALARQNSQGAASVLKHQRKVRTVREQLQSWNTREKCSSLKNAMLMVAPILFSVFTNINIWHYMHDNYTNHKYLYTIIILLILSVKENCPASQ